MMLRRFCRWILQDEVGDMYFKGWHDGVIQHMHEPDSCYPISWIAEDWPTKDEYWGDYR